MDELGIMLDRERQMPYDFTYMWDLKNKTNETETNSQIKKAKWWWSQHRQVGRQVEKMKGIKKYKLPAIK